MSERGLVELRRVRQIAVPEEVADLLEARPSRQIFDVVATVGEAAVLAVEVAELRLGGDDPLEPADQLGAFLVHGRASRSQIAWMVAGIRRARPPVLASTHRLRSKEPQVTFRGTGSLVRPETARQGGGSR